MNFLLGGLGIAHLAGMPGVEVDDDVMVGRHLLDQGRHRAYRLRELRILGVRGEDMNAFAFMIVFGGGVTLPSVHRYESGSFRASGCDSNAR